ncbi:TPA: primosomal protein N' [Candidatus Berkelbacteria bacterium]|uniref:Replication restart protein PriA n=1 Tax=Berkelbacteria bacterium GW2011_GWE1_39_12 TaxID=1618337 RepID=A0A0G4B402_9BACT|nr:MAG: primosome assembly protein PriA [Berkelbacteria bacterium GW2011_GWE1_39_12]HBO60323.1 primosomal protein N' [Candidatus Berkelbacteria bacterium]
MQIAKVIPKVKTSGDGIFDYSIPPEILPQIKCGVLVEVPFHGRTIEAIVMDIRRSSQIQILKPIIKIIDPNPVIDNLHLKLAKWMSDYYLAPLGQTLFENIVPSAKRTIKKNESEIAVQPSSLNLTNNRFLIIADFSRRLKFYLQAIEKTIKRKQSVLILIPDLSLIDYFAPKLKDLIILHANLTKTERWIAWDKARRKPFSIVIGSQSALFAPINNLGLIIVDQFESLSFKNDRSPRFSTVETAKKLTEFSKANLIIGSLTPDIENFYQAQKNYKILKHNFLKPKIEIIDTSNAKSILSETLKKNIEKNLFDKKKTLLVFNRKGEGNYYTCTNCNWIFNCKQCDLPLRPFENKAVCQRCDKTFDLPTNCEKCHGINLKKTGLGTRKLSKIIKDNWPKSTIINLEKDGDELTNDFDIAIATNYALKLNLPKIDLVAILDMDSYLYLPDFKSAENAFDTYYKFLKISDQGLIQTSRPDAGLSKSLAALDYESFFNHEINLRRKESFPPFTKMINLIFQNEDEEICKKDSIKTAKSLNGLKSNSTEIESLEILGPNPAFVFKKLNKSRWQIIIKHKNVLPENIRAFLLKQRNVIIDVDPVDLI